MKKQTLKRTLAMVIALLLAFSLLGDMSLRAEEVTTDEVSVDKTTEAIEVTSDTETEPDDPNVQPSELPDKTLQTPEEEEQPQSTATSGDEDGVDLSGMTESEVKAYVEQAIAETFAGNSLSQKHFYPLFGTDENAVDTVKIMLKDKGFEDIEVSLATGDIFNSEPSAAVLDDGKIVYMKDNFANPATSFNTNFRQLQTEYTFTKDGFSFSYLIKTHVAWDIADVESQFSPYMQSIDDTYVMGSNASLDEMTSQVVLHGRPKDSEGNEVRWINIKWTWQPDDPADVGNVRINQQDPFQPYGPYNVTFNHKEHDIKGKLVADFEMVKVGVPTSRRGPIDTFKRQKSFSITIPGKSMKQELEDELTKVDLNKLFIADVTPATPIDPEAVTSDIRFANWRELGISSTNRSIQFISSDPETVAVNSFRGTVYRPQPGNPPSKVTISVRLTHRPSGQFAEKVIGDITVLPLDLDLTELREAKALMEKAIAAYREGLMGDPEDPENNQDPSRITTHLHNFAEVASTDDGKLKWIRTYAEREFNNIAAVEIDPETTQEQWRLFRSSRPDLIKHENLLFMGQPKYDATVIVESVLSHQTYEKYAPILDPEDKSEIAEILRFLYRQPVRAEFTVAGTNGPDPNGGKVPVTFTVIGSKPILRKDDHADAHELWFTSELFVEPGTTLLELTSQLLDRPDEGFKLVAPWGFITSISVPEKGTNTYQITNGVGSSWMWYTDIDGELHLGQVGAGQYLIKEDDHLVWKFENDPAYPFEVVQESPDTPLELPETPDHWTGFAKNNDNNAVFETDAVRQPAKQIVWSERLAEPDMWGTSYNSDYLILGDFIYVANGETLFKLNKNGQEQAKTPLRTSMKYFARLSYDNGLIIVPLAGGALQAVRVSDMKTVWVADALKYLKWEPIDSDDPYSDYEPVHYNLQNVSSTYIQDGIVYSATSAVRGLDPFGGYLRSVDMSTGRTLWLKDIPGGFYWSGPVQVGDALLIAGEDGVLRAFNTKNGDELARISIHAKVRSTIVKQGDNLYFTDIDGHLHQVPYDAASQRFGTPRKINFSSRSTSTPTIYNDRAYVGGDGVFAVIDLNTMTVIQTFSIDGPVQSTPLVVPSKNGDIHVYFTANNESGALLVYDGKSVQAAYEPSGEAMNYTTSSAVIDQEGVIYYSNDSGYLFALRDLQDEAILSLDITRMADSYLDTASLIRIEGTLLQSATLVFQPEQDTKRKNQGEAQFAEQRRLFFQIEQSAESETEPILTKDGYFILNVTTTDEFSLDATAVRLLRFDPERGEYSQDSAQLPANLSTNQQGETVLRILYRPGIKESFALIATLQKTPDVTDPVETKPEESTPTTEAPVETDPTETIEPTTPAETEPTSTETMDNVIPDTTTSAPTSGDSPADSSDVPKTGEAAPLAAAGGAFLLLAAAVIYFSKKSLNKR